jgi:hypothetical protein
VFFGLFHLGLALCGSALPPTEVLAAADDVRAVALEEPPLFAGSDGRERTARLLMVFAWKESAWRADVTGDHGAACGVLQLHNVARAGVSCAAIRADRRLGLRVGLAFMRDLRDRCGSVRAGLRAFASGTCAGSIRARELVAHRCSLAGGCQ